MTTPRHYKPRILLIDMPEQTGETLSDLGYNISSGHWGVMHRCRPVGELRGVTENFDLPSHTEQDILCVDLARSGAPTTGYRTPGFGRGLMCWFQRPTTGWVGCASLAQTSLSDDFDRIVNHGGVFVIFMQERIRTTYLRAQFIEWYNNGNPDIHGAGRQELITNNLGFLSMLRESHLYVRHDSGKDIRVITTDSSVSRILGRHKQDARFEATFSRGSSLAAKIWMPMAESSYGATVAAQIGPLKSGGLILLVPQIKDKASFVRDLLVEALPEMTPHLFPDHAAHKWVKSTAYAFPKVLALKEQQKKVLAEADKRKDALQDQINEYEETLRFAFDICTQTGGDLVTSVQQCLEFLEFGDVRDVDKEEDQLQEDLQIMGSGSPILLEVKGINGLPREDDTLQVVKYLVRRQREWSDTDIHALSVINHQRNLPPRERDNQGVFTKSQVNDARDLGYGLVTTWDLHQLMRGVVVLGWPKNTVQSMLRKTGRILTIPPHYEYLGDVVEVWKEPRAFSVTGEKAIIRQGDRLAVKVAGEFTESVVESLQLEDESVPEATLERVVGMKLASGVLPRKKAKVYRIAPNKD